MILQGLEHLHSGAHSEVHLRDMRGSDSFNLCPRKKQGENLSSLSLVSELLEKNKESRRIRSVFLASLTRK